MTDICEKQPHFFEMGSPLASLVLGGNLTVFHTVVLTNRPRHKDMLPSFPSKRAVRTFQHSLRAPGNQSQALRHEPELAREAAEAPLYELPSWHAATTRKNRKYGETAPLRALKVFSKIRCRLSNFPEVGPTPF